MQTTLNIKEKLIFRSKHGEKNSGKIKITHSMNCIIINPTV